MSNSLRPREGRTARAVDWSAVIPLRIRARALADGVYAGSHRSARRGPGVEFGGHRQYAPGDDLRWLDRRSLLLHDRLVTREFETDTDRAVRVLVDASSSMGFCGRASALSKLELACLIAAALARIALSTGDPVSLDWLLGERTVRVPISGGREAFERFVDASELARPGGEMATTLDALDRAIEPIARAARRGSVVVVLSDLLDMPKGAIERVSGLSSRGHVLVVVEVLDREEREFPFDETVRLRALEGKVSVHADGEARAGYLAAMEARRAEWAEGLRARGARLVSATTDEPPVNALREILAALR